MKQKMTFLFCLLTIMFACTLFPSCNSDSEEAEKTELTNGGSSTIIVAANTPSGSVNFYASAEWSAYTSSTKSRGGDDVNWISLNKTAGSAGEACLTFMLARNDTGKARTAYIIIVCGDDELVITVTQTTETDPDAGANFTWTLDNVTGFTATFTSDYPENIAGGVEEGKVFISEQPFTEEDIPAEGDNPFGAVKQAKQYGAGNTCTIVGLQPQRVYYVMQIKRDFTEKTYYSNLIRIITPDESWIEKVRCAQLTIKDAQVSVWLKPIEAEWNGYDVECGYEIVSKDKQMSAKYRKVSPESEKWADTDSPRSGIKLSDDNSFIIELHNLQPGEVVSVTPWISIDGTRHEGERVEFQTYKIATTGFVRIGAGMFAACNVGASLPYETGTMYKDPKDVVLEGNAIIPTFQYWETLMAGNKMQVCGTLEGKAGWFVIDGKNTIFLPFNKQDEDGNHFGYYWGGDKYHPADWGADAMAQLFFRCWDTPNLYSHMHYGTDQYVLPGRNEMMVRLAKWE